MHIRLKEYLDELKASITELNEYLKDIKDIINFFIKEKGKLN